MDRSGNFLSHTCSQKPTTVPNAPPLQKTHHHHHHHSRLRPFRKSLTACGLLSPHANLLFRYARWPHHHLCEMKDCENLFYDNISCNTLACPHVKWSSSGVETAQQCSGPVPDCCPTSARNCRDWERRLLRVTMAMYKYFLIFDSMLETRK